VIVWSFLPREKEFIAKMPRLKPRLRFELRDDEFRNLGLDLAEGGVPFFFTEVITVEFGMEFANPLLNRPAGRSNFSS